MKYFVKKRFSLILIIVLLLFGLYASKELFRYYAFFTHDGDHHISRGFDAVETLIQGGFPLRWAGSLNAFCGVPVYNFFYPLIYYLVYIINFFTKDVINSLKIIYALSFIVAPVFFYLWLLSETKNKFSSFVGAILYLFVPYRFLLVYVRGSPEFLSYTILPVLLYFLSLFLNSPVNKNIVLLSFLTAITGGLLVISHNFAAMFLVPIIVLYLLYKVLTLKAFKDKRKMFLLFFILISFFGLSAFFVGPAFLEQGFIKLSVLKTINYSEHFPTLGQLIKSPWGFGYSSPGVANDGMSFALGYAQWIVLGFSTVFLLVKLIVSRKRKLFVSENLMVIFWLLLSLITIFLILPASLFIWEKISYLQEVQFSWRLLGITSFTIACLGGFLLASFRNKYLAFLLGLFFVSVAVYGNRNHLLVQPVNKINWYYDYEKNHPHRYETTTFADDILGVNSIDACRIDEPFFALSLPGNKVESAPFRQKEINAPFTGREDTAYAPDFKKDFLYRIDRKNLQGKATITSPVNTIVNVKLNLEYYPKAYLLFFDDGPVENFYDCSGRICIDNVEMPEGKHFFSWKIIQTPIEKIFNAVTVIFVGAWFIVIFAGRKRLLIND